MKWLAKEITYHINHAFRRTSCLLLPMTRWSISRSKLHFSPAGILYRPDLGPLLLYKLFLYVTLQHTVDRPKSGRRAEEERRTNTRDVLAIYSGNNLTAELQLIQSSQHPLTTVRSPDQIDHEHLDAHK